MRLLYFAWVRERIGRSEEDVTPPASAATIEALLAWLEGRGEGYKAALADRARLRFAVNLAHAGLSAPIGPEDEIAIFPPVTGGAA